MKSLHRTSTAREPFDSSVVNRRTLLGAALGVGGTALLAACGSQGRGGVFFIFCSERFCF